MSKTKTKTKRTKTPREGNPFLAFRVPRKLLAAFTRHARSYKTTREDLIRCYMASATGIEP